MKQLINQASDHDMISMRQLFHSGGTREFVKAVKVALRRVLTMLHVEELYDSVITLVEQEHWFRNLESTWELLKPEHRARRWEELMNHLVETAYSKRPYCVRCGECCRQGSPSLHPEDAGLLAEGILSPRQVYTLRKGEAVNLNLEQRLGILPEELIKIRQRPENGQCIFYVDQQRSCAIYEHRPLQCRIQACWNPGPLQELWHQEKLTRRHLFRDDETLLELMEAHEQHCSPEKLHSAFRKLHESGDENALEQVLDLLRYDTALRSLVVERLRRDVEELDLLFGRSLANLVRAYGVRVEKDTSGTFRLVPDEQNP